MRRLVAIAGDVRHPAERPAIRHLHREFLARARHARTVERRSRDDGADIGEERKLRLPVEIGRVIDGAWADLDRSLRHARRPRRSSKWEHLGRLAYHARE